MNRQKADFIEQLNQLSKLRAEGAVSEQEFEEFKEKLIAAQRAQEGSVQQSSAIETAEPIKTPTAYAMALATFPIWGLLILMAAVIGLHSAHVAISQVAIAYGFAAFVLAVTLFLGLRDLYALDENGVEPIGSAALVLFVIFYPLLGIYFWRRGTALKRAYGDAIAFPRKHLLIWIVSAAVYLVATVPALNRSLIQKPGGVVEQHIGQAVNTATGSPNSGVANAPQAGPANVPQPEQQQTSNAGDWSVKDASNPIDGQVIQAGKTFDFPDRESAIEVRLTCSVKSQDLSITLISYSDKDTNGKLPGKKFITDVSQTGDIYPVGRLKVGADDPGVLDGHFIIDHYSNQIVATSYTANRIATNLPAWIEVQNEQGTEQVSIPADNASVNSVLDRCGIKQAAHTPQPQAATAPSDSSSPPGPTQSDSHQ